MGLALRGCLFTVGPSVGERILGIRQEGFAEIDVPVAGECHPDAGRSIYADVEKDIRNSAVNDSLRAIVLTIRPIQWLKNILVFLPIVVSHQLFSREKLVFTGVAFAAFSMCASAVYISNDLFDVEEDRKHPKKKFRPIASGRLGVLTALAALLLLVLLSFGSSLVFLPVRMAFVLASYLAISLGYTYILKRATMSDVVVLSLVHVLRVIGGGVATGIEISNWLLGFSFFLFASLALAKRYTEIISLRALGDFVALPGRGYFSGDGPIISSLGITCGVTSVLVLALYVHSPEARLLYRAPRVLALLCPLLLLWIGRVWIAAARGDWDDPVLFSATDRGSLAVAAASLCILGCSI